MLIIPSSEYAAFYGAYISKVQNFNVLQALSESKERLLKGAENLDKEQANFRYQPEKWSVKGVLQHIIDAERVFSYRALCIARGEKKSLLGFDENEYADNALVDGKEMSQIIDEFLTTRAASISLFASFNEEQLLKLGIANDKTISVRAIGAIIVGHELHHLDVLNARYGLNF